MRKAFWFFVWLWIIKKIQGEHYFAPTRLQQSGIVDYKENGNLVTITVDKSKLKANTKIVLDNH